MLQKMTTFMVDPDATRNTQHATRNTQHATRIVYLLTFFLIFLFGHKDLLSQSHQCGTPDPTSREMEELLGKLGRKDLRSVDCTDPVWSGGDQTYNLILEYAPDQTPYNVIKNIADYINSSYAPLGIFFNITFKPSDDCSNCTTGLEPGWGFAWDSPTYTNCIYGRIAKDFKVDGYTGFGDLISGSFISQPYGYLVVHELGHALGLLHTYFGFTPSKHEYVLQQEGSSCGCNCLIEGDLVCDTNVDPYFLADSIWCIAMFNEASAAIVNINNETDNCGTNYRDIPDHASVMRNFMSYHKSTNLDRFTPGQGDMIKFLNQSKPWLSTNSGGSVVSMLTSVDVPTTISSNTVFNHDLTLNSSLTFENCTVYVAKDKKIIMNGESKLVLKNAVIRDLDAGSCLAESGKWDGIVVNERATIKLRDHSVIKGSRNTLISKPASPGLLAVLVEDGSELYNEDKTILSSTGNTYMRVKNGKLTGDVLMNDNSNGLSTFEINRSVLSTGTFKLTNVGVEVIYSTLEKFADIILYNDQSIKKIYFTNNTINSLNFRVDASIGLFKLNSNEIYSFIDLKNINDFDLHNNVFLGKGSVKFDNGIVNKNKNLVFKNTFNQTSAPRQNYSVFIDGKYSGTAIECNDFNYNTTDLKVSSSGSIAEKQGDGNMAAGNSFSRNTPEVDYESNNTVIYYFLDQATEEPVNISGVNSSKFIPEENTGSSASKCDLSYPRPPEYPGHCGNNIKDGDEEGVDCGGSCKPCKHTVDDIDMVIQVPGIDHCSDGIRNHDETGIDCGGRNCPPCDSCNDGIMNNGETGIDCGGPYCPPCNTEYCNNGIQDNGETGIDCGGPCTPCGDPPSVSSCNNGIQDNGETGIDCGGPCAPCQVIYYIPSCYNGIQDNGETGIDCGGPCPDCLTWTVTGTGGPIIISGTGNGNGAGTGTGTGEGTGNNIDSTVVTGGSGITATWFKRHTAALSNDFIDELHQQYGAGFIPLGEDLDIRAAKRALAAQMDNGSTPQLIAMISSDSQTDAASVLSALRLASPYVSVSAIHAFFGQSIYFTQAETADILSRNPGVVSDPYVHDVVYNSGSITGTYKTDILNAIAAGDQRMQSEEVIRVRDHYMQALMRNHLLSAMEGFTPDYNEMRSLLLKKDDYTSVFDIYETFIAEGQYQFADTYISMWDANDISDPYFKLQLQKFQVVHAILYKYYFAGNRLVALPNADRVVLETIADGCFGKATLKARSVLTDLFEADFETKPVCNPYPPLTFAPGTQIRTSAGVKYAVQPNPASEYLEVFCFDRLCQNATLTVYDINGFNVGHYSMKAQETKIDVSSLISGVYMYRIISGTQYVQTGKFIKIK